MNPFKPISLLGLAALLAAPALAQQSLILIPAQDERVFTAPQPVPVQPPASPIPQTVHVDPFAGSPSFEGEYLPGPVDDFQGEIVSGPIYVDETPIPLFTRVKYVDKREMHPHAVTKIIAVKNPILRRFCKECVDDTVYIEICVPPCDCREDVICRRRGTRVRYDYGKYKVDVRVRRGYIVVDYQD